MVVRSTGFRIIQVQTCMANALASLSLLDIGGQEELLHRAAWQEGARLLKSPWSRPATSPKFTAVKLIVHSICPWNGFLTQVSRSEHPFH